VHSNQAGKLSQPDAVDLIFLSHSYITYRGIAPIITTDKLIKFMWIVISFRRNFGKE